MFNREETIVIINFRPSTLAIIADRLSLCVHTNLSRPSTVSIQSPFIIFQPLYRFEFERQVPAYK
jgi:hypothetical protein